MQSPIPVLSMRKLYLSASDRQQFIADLGRAARDIGFFYLEDHGISLAEQVKVLDTAKTFFALSDVEKKQVQMIHSPHFRGYSANYSELTAGRRDRREQFDIMDELPAQATSAIRHEWQKLIGPNQWPEQLPAMKTQLLSWQNKLTEVSLQLLEALCESLEQPADALAETISNGPYRHTKLIKYPGSPEASGQGVGAHKDPGYLTLVLQDENSGLEVEYEQQWYKVAPRPGAFVVNIGELLELASNGYLKATNHRVTSPKTGVTRYSSAFFMAAQLNASVPVLKLPSHLAKHAKGPTSDPNNPLLHNVGENVMKGRKRSHPDVSMRFYPKTLKCSSY
ncbi:2-oxoglutarate and iron-dependent oxygenase domain-containing protein [Idiomarina sp. PL1-037]|uniref:isopenicillin N synthase family dioxygenase n=1 Tax=Idiomarina sp. PL1-037 TaxID=3095365 RepID=UPI002ACBE8D7|nr:2-oxoglutarate and iron-dependent oxygenase domain-containing protein [Idiomarina sp. PL1-037]WQC53152.1 2-oxoglutarate and iron-dependent oxygenase domain-containing protein [Idiomarina sp. PL1-037]